MSKKSSKKKTATTCHSKVSASQFSTDDHIPIYTKEQAINDIKNKLTNTTPKIEEEQEIDLIKKEKEILLICACLECSNNIDDKLLRVFSYFIYQSQDFQYNIGFLMNKIPELEKSLKNIQDRFNHILNSYNSLRNKSNIKEYVFRYDELYDFSIKDKTINVEIKLENAKNIILDNNTNRKYTIRILDLAETTKTLAVFEKQSLTKITLEAKSKIIKLHTIQ